MFGLFKEIVKRTKYEMYARDYLAEKFFFDKDGNDFNYDALTAFQRSALTDDVLETMKKLGLDDEIQFAVLLVVELQKNGYIVFG